MVKVPKAKPSHHKAKYLTLLFVPLVSTWLIYAEVGHIHGWLGRCITLILILFAVLSAFLMFSMWLLRLESPLMDFIFEIERINKHFDRK
ncbi:hypothetical protein SAMN02746095_01861 [Acidocella aminolytica 101 = DSM 11237]|uniref:Uncharacterized protein n=1 Tax=Acidocella aminolytica 101 = DSM 11237 TaxID=1120923 RepID=A0A0D6PJ81_9PROT|nr:hypothetical protein Aam_096_010 [Acidocella aminolytica 101 = DSM 11237]SHF01790.1 hypothetical protein SAMN02746095_01861 [Acidocella aminolytica 101 = DSM 11237]